MIYTIELTPQELQRIQNAQAKGIDVTALFKGVIAGLPPVEKEPVEDRTLELFAQWKAEAEAMTPEEIAAEDADWDEIMENIQKNRLSLPVPDVSDHD
ncbi:MAG TPA: hypothetical protein VFB38_13740 [Chthonomonadaceae bacterium]|nr:hypothetical protein [Chthonomonadaceae bacterium]